MNKHILRTGFLLVLASLAMEPVAAKSAKTKEVVKELYIPEEVRNSCGNLQVDTGEYSFKRMKETENLALFWSKKFGTDPMANPDSMLRFDVDYILREGERIYRFYVDDLKFVKKGSSISDKYKLLIFIVNSKNATAYGGGMDEKIGAFWAPPVRMRKAPFGALAHEMGHSFQYMLGIDRSADTKNGRGGASQPEVTSQYMLWQVYPEWLTFENYHLNDYMKQTHLAFLHPSNMYHAPQVFEYWANLHGIDIISRIWQESLAGEDNVMTYKRLMRMDQKSFNDEIFDAYRHFITWDMKRIEQVARPYADQHFTMMDAVGDGWYRIAASKCPQNYGYNGIKLMVPAAGTMVELEFKGLAGAEGFSAVKVDKAGWRYGFLAHLANGKRVYGKICSDSVGRTSFKVPKNTRYLWLVVSGAPTEHWAKGWRDKNEEQWPYQIKLIGTTVDVSAMK